MSQSKLTLLSLPLSVVVALGASSARGQERRGEWPCYGRDPGGTRHSPLTQIDRTNVGQLKPVWTYRTGDSERIEGSALANKIAFEATPLAVDGVLYLSTAFARVIALDAATGKERWTFDASCRPAARRRR